MNSIEQIKQAKLPSRRKFVWGLGIMTVFAAISTAVKAPFLSKKKGPLFGKPEIKNKTVTMLTQDGRLVQIDGALLAANSKKVTDTELQNWIKK